MPRRIPRTHGDEPLPRNGPEADTLGNTGVKQTCTNVQEERQDENTRMWDGSTGTPEDPVRRQVIRNRSQHHTGISDLAQLRLPHSQGTKPREGPRRHAGANRRDLGGMSAKFSDGATLDRLNSPRARGIDRPERDNTIMYALPRHGRGSSARLRSAAKTRKDFPARTGMHPGYGDRAVKDHDCPARTGIIRSFGGAPRKLGRISPRARGTRAADTRRGPTRPDELQREQLTGRRQKDRIDTWRTGSPTGARTRRSSWP